MNIITVCTANVCRSPAAHLLLQDRLGPSAVVSSGGVHALTGSPMDPRSVQALLDAGLSERTLPQVDTFRASELTPSRAAGADLILTATTEHRDRAVRLTPRSLKRAFTLLEFAQLAAPITAAGGDRPDSPSGLVALAARHRARAAGPLDIADPVGLDADAYRRVMATVDDVVQQVVTTLRPWFAPAPHGGDT